jgi:hypothetical protein
LPPGASIVIVFCNQLQFQWLKQSGVYPVLFLENPEV